MLSHTLWHFAKIYAELLWPVALWCAPSASNTKEIAHDSHNFPCINSLYFRFWFIRTIFVSKVHEVVAVGMSALWHWQLQLMAYKSIKTAADHWECEDKRSENAENVYVCEHNFSAASCSGCRTLPKQWLFYVTYDFPHKQAPIAIWASCGMYGGSSLISFERCATVRAPKLRAKHFMQTVWR